MGCCYTLTRVIDICFVCPTKALCFQSDLIHVKLFHDNVIELVPLTTCLASIYNIPVSTWIENVEAILFLFLFNFLIIFFIPVYIPLIYSSYSRRKSQRLICKNGGIYLFLAISLYIKMVLALKLALNSFVSSLKAKLEENHLSLMKE